MRHIMILVVMALLAPTAGAHAALMDASPAHGSNAPRGTTDIALSFSERVDPALVDVAVLTTTTGDVIASAEAKTSSASVIVPIDPLADGIYTVRWRVLSLDGHVTSGGLTFSVGNRSLGVGYTATRYDQAALDASPVWREGLVRAIANVGALLLVGIPAALGIVTTSPAARRRARGSGVVFGTLAAAATGVLLLLIARSTGLPAAAVMTSRPGAQLVGAFVLLVVASALVSLNTPERATRIGTLMTSTSALGLLVVAPKAALAEGATPALVLSALGAGGLGIALGLLAVALHAESLLHRTRAVVAVGLVVALFATPGGAILHASWGVLMAAGVVDLVVIGVVALGVALALLRADHVVAQRAQMALVVAAVIAASIFMASAHVPAVPEDAASFADAPGGFQVDGVTRSSHVILGIAPDPPRIGIHTAALTVHAALALDDVNASLALIAPNGATRPDIPLDRLSDNRWVTDRLSFDVAGDWHVVVKLDRQGDVESVDLRVPVVAGPQRE